MNIILFTSVFYNNIGNGFIDIGAEFTIDAAKPKEAKLIKLSQCANFAATMDWKFRVREFPGVRFVWNNLMKKFAKQLHDRSYGLVKGREVISMALITKCDYFIIPGCVLTVPFFTIYGNLLEEKVAQGSKLIFLGASGNHYTSNEITFVRRWLERLDPHGMIFRDTVAFNAYKDCCPRCYNGIDNVFFVNRIDLPEIQTTLTPYYVLNFDLKENRTIEHKLRDNDLQGKNIIYTNHKPYPWSSVTKAVKKGVMISDYPLDYLTIYRNVEVTYSDRVHACIPTLSFGNYARLYSKSPRKSLFENVGLHEIGSKPVKLYGLEDYQENQISFLRALFQ